MSNSTPPPPPAYAAPSTPPGTPGTPGAPGEKAGRYNVLAIVSLVSAFIVSLVAIVTGHIALSQIKRTGEKGRPLALAGVILGYVFTLAWIAAIVALIVFAAAKSSEIVENSDLGLGSGPGSQSTVEPFATASPAPGSAADAASCETLLSSISASTADLQANATQLQTDPVAAVAALQGLSDDLDSGLSQISDPTVIAAGEKAKGSLQNMIADIQALAADPTGDSSIFFADAQAVQDDLAAVYSLCS